MSNLNKDGLEIGQPVSFADIQRINSKRKEAAKNGTKTESKPVVRKTTKPSVSNVSKAKETKEAQGTA